MQENGSILLSALRYRTRYRISVATHCRNAIPAHPMTVHDRTTHPYGRRLFA